MSKVFLVEPSDGSFIVYSQDDQEEIEIHFSGVPSQKVAALLSSALKAGYESGYSDAQVVMCYWPSLEERLANLADGFEEDDQL